MDACAYLAVAGAGLVAFLVLRLRAEIVCRREAEKARALLSEIVDALPGGFVAWDADDRLVTHDQEFLRVYEKSAPFIVPGARFENVIRSGALAGQYPASGKDIEAFVRKTVTDHQRGGQTFERQMPDGTWLLVSEKRMTSGGIVGVRTDITAIKRTEAALAEATARAEHLALHDPLTGLPNRSAFDAALSAACNGEGSVSLLCLDLDGFKAVNDVLGHAAGDLVLREAAARIRSAAGHGAIVARLGGDEFAVILPADTSEKDAEGTAAKLVSELCRPYMVEGQEVRDVGASVGVSCDRDIAPDAIARDADRACYLAKRAGRSTWRRTQRPVSQAA